jgi:primosomal protein N' (replication factor Y)
MNTNAKQLNKVFDYIVPKELEESIRIGARVFVPFGKGNNLAEGYVLELKNNSEFAQKDIAKIEDFILTEENIELAKLMADKYFCNVSDCIKLMLPPGNSSKDLTKRVREKTARFVYLNVDKESILNDIENKVIKSDKHIRLLKFLVNNEGMEVRRFRSCCGCFKIYYENFREKWIYKVCSREIREKSFNS